MSDALLLTGGKVVTALPDGPVVEAVAVEKDRVVAVGAAGEVAAAAPGAKEVVDLGGRTVVPGPVDTHLHLLYTGWSLGDIDVYGVSSVEELVERLSAGAEGRDGLIAGRSDCIHPRHLAEGRLPTCRDLDRVSPDRAVAVTDVNKTIVNSVILDGIDAGDIPAGGEVGRFEDGSPNGVFLYAAKAMTPLGKQSAASGSQASEREAIERAQDALVAAGITGVVDASVGANDFAVLARMASEGALKIRVRALLRAAYLKSFDAVREILDGFGDGDDMLRIAGVKLFYDPFLMHRTALFYEPYRSGDPSNCGRRTLSPEELTRWLRDCAREGLATGTHTTGTRGTDEVIAAHEKIADEVGLASPSHVIHAYFPGEKALDRIRALGMGVALQPSFIRPWAETALDFLGPERAAGFTPVRSYLDAGIVTAGGTDSPITHFDPFASMAAAASRSSAAGNVLGPEERVTNAEALGIYTSGAAELTGEDSHRGLIAPGALADMVVCSADPTSCGPDDMRNVRALMTVVGGRVVHRAEGF